MELLRLLGGSWQLSLEKHHSDFSSENMTKDRFGRGSGRWSFLLLVFNKMPGQFFLSQQVFEIINHCNHDFVMDFRPHFFLHFASSFVPGMDFHHFDLQHTSLMLVKLGLWSHQLRLILELSLRLTLKNASPTG